MPLLDHFRPPLSERYPADSLHSNWATRIADNLNQHWLSERFRAAENTHLGATPEIDIATYESPEPQTRRFDINGNGAIAVAPAIWTAPAPLATIAMTYPDTFEVEIRAATGWHTLLAVIELVSEGNKDRLASRQAFAAKSVAYLQRGVSVALIDIVTVRHANLHHEILDMLGAGPDLRMPAEPQQYAASYRPTMRGEKPEADIWSVPFGVGDELPTMPLRLKGDLFVPVEFEATYMEACRKRRLI